MIPAARGTTVALQRISSLEDILGVVSGLGDEFTGRIIVEAARGDGSIVSLVALVDKGSIVALSLNGKLPDELDEVAASLSEVVDGYVEVQKLDKAGVELDLEFNPSYRLAGPIPLRELIELFREAVERREERVERESTVSEAEASAPIVEAQQQPPGAQPTAAEEESVQEAVQQVAVAAGEESVGEAAGVAATVEAEVEAETPHREEAVPVEARAEAAEAEAGVERQAGPMEEEAAEAAVVGTEVEAQVVSMEAGHGAEAKPGVEEVGGKPLLVSELEEEVVEEEVVEDEVRRFIESLPSDIRNAISIALLEEVSKRYYDNVEAVYYTVVHNSSPYQVLKGIPLVDALRTLIQASRQGYAGLLVELDSHEARVYAYGGRICVAVITTRNPFEIKSYGIRALLALAKLIQKNVTNVKYQITMITNIDAMRKLLPCGPPIELVYEDEERKRKKRRRLLPFFGR